MSVETDKQTWKMDAETCDRVRRQYQRGYSSEELATMDWVPVEGRNVRRHICGECSCDNDEPAVDIREQDQERIHPFECAALRLLGACDYHPDVLGFIGGFQDKRSVKRHIHGECTCDCPVDPVPEYRTGGESP